MIDFIKKLWERKVVRFLVIGCFNTAFDISLLLSILKILDWSPLIANSLSVSIAVTVSYFLNHRIVFRETSGYTFKKYLHFFLVTGLGVILIQDVVIYLVIDKFWVISQAKTWRLLGHATSLRTLELLGAKLSGVVIGLAWNYLLYKYLVFRNHDEEDELFIG